MRHSSIYTADGDKRAGNEVLVVQAHKVATTIEGLSLSILR